MARISATEVAQDFSAVLGRLALGEDLEVFQKGQLVARITPARPTALSASAFRALMLAAPSADLRLARSIEHGRGDR